MKKLLILGSTLFSVGFANGQYELRDLSNDLKHIQIEKKYLNDKLRLLNKEEKALTKRIMKLHENLLQERNEERYIDRQRGLAESIDRQRRMSDMMDRQDLAEIHQKRIEALQNQQRYVEEPRRMKQREYDEYRDAWFRNLEEHFQTRPKFSLIEDLKNKLSKNMEDLKGNTKQLGLIETNDNETSIDYNFFLGEKLKDEEINIEIEKGFLKVLANKRTKTENSTSNQVFSFINKLPKNVDTKSIKRNFNEKTGIVSISFEKMK